MTLLSPRLDHSTIREPKAPQGLHGVLVVNKPDGWTSHDVVKRIRIQLGIQKVGHAGTLDPHATGVLPILIGKGTKIAQYLQDWDKEYAAVLELGQTMDTQDAWGIVQETRSCAGLSEEMIRSVFGDFRGSMQQVPPMYSAVKVNGQPLYKKARKGQTVERQPKTVVIHDLEIQGIAIPEISFRVVCSKGTYVRTLCADIGECLGVGGHLKWLQRSRVGPLRLDQALEMETLEEGVEITQVDGAWWSLDRILEGFPAVEVNEEDARKVLHGNAIPWNRVEWATSNFTTTDLNTSRRVRVKSPEGALLALGSGPKFQPGLHGPVLALDTVLG